jgi:hypothetical protein
MKRCCGFTSARYSGQGRSERSSSSTFRASTLKCLSAGYRTGGLYKSVVTTVGIVENVTLNIRDAAHFISLCRKRSVFDDQELMKWWDYKKHNRPFIVEFLYAYSFTKRPNMKELIDHGIIRDVSSAPQGFEPLTKEQFRTILRLAQADPRSFVN